MPIKDKSNKVKFIWLKMKKSYKGGMDEYQFRVPNNMSTSSLECILKYLGENTNGGHNYGFSIITTKLKKMSDDLKVLKYPEDLVPETVGFGEEVITTSIRKII